MLTNHRLLVAFAAAFVVCCGWMFQKSDVRPVNAARSISTTTPPTKSAAIPTPLQLLPEGRKPPVFPPTEEEETLNRKLSFLDRLAPPLTFEEEEAYLLRERRSSRALVGIALNRTPGDPRTIELINEAISRDPRDPLAYRALLAQDLSKQKDMTIVDRLLEITPHQADLLMMKAEDARRAGRQDEAEKLAIEAANQTELGLDHREFIGAAKAAYEGAGRDTQSAELRGFYQMAKTPILPLLTTYVGVSADKTVSQNYAASVASLAIRFSEAPGMKSDNTIALLEFERSIYQKVSPGTSQPAVLPADRPLNELIRDAEAERKEAARLHEDYAVQRECILQTLNAIDRSEYLRVCGSKGEIEGFRWLESDRPEIARVLRTRWQPLDRRPVAAPMRKLN